MKAVCPISFNQINERAAQLNAALTVISLIVFFFTPYTWIILVLAVDFFIRGFLNLTYSYYSAVSKTILRVFKVKPLMVNAGPKIFAARIGFLFCCLTGVCHALNFPGVSLVIGLVFMFFAGLEAMFRFCVACRLYPFVCKFLN